MAGIVRYVARHSLKQTAIVEGLRRRIIAGEFAVGSKLPTVGELEKTFDASRVTVQRAVGYLCSSGYLFTRAREGIYVSPNPPHLCNFGLLIPQQPHQQFFIALQQEALRISDGPERLDGMSRRVTVFHEVPCRAEDVAGAHRALIEEVEAHRMAGLIFAMPAPRFGGTPVLADWSLPHVVIGAMPDVPGVSIEGFMQMAIDHLLARGRRRIAVIVSAESSREAAFADVDWRGLSLDERWVQGVSLNAPHWAGPLVRLLLSSGGTRPDGLIIADDNFVPAASAGIQAARVRVPEDLDVVAHANFPYLTPCSVPAVRIGYDAKRILNTCIDLIVQQRKGLQVPKVTHIPASLGEAGEDS